MPKQPKSVAWERLDEPARRDVVTRAVRAIIEPLERSNDAPAKHALVGLYCHKMLKACEREDMCDWSSEERDYVGTTWQFQCRVVDVIGDAALLQFYSAFDGYPTVVKPLLLSDLLDGTWQFYASHAEWVSTADDINERINRVYDAQRRRFELSVSRLARELCDHQSPHACAACERTARYTLSDARAAGRSVSEGARDE